MLLPVRKDKDPVGTRATGEWLNKQTRLFRTSSELEHGSPLP
jgi:hypothetical protein